MATRGTTAKAGPDPARDRADRLVEQRPAGLGGDISLEQCLSEAHAAGYAGVENGTKFPLEPKELRPILDAHGLKLITGWFSGELRRRTLRSRAETAWRRSFGFYQELNAPVLVFAETTDTVQNEIDARSAIGRAWRRRSSRAMASG